MLKSMIRTSVLVSSLLIVSVSMLGGHALAYGNKGKALGTSKKKAAAEADEKVSGQVTISKKLAESLPKGGVLYIFAKSFNSQRGIPPLAVKRIVSPKFPVKFDLSSKDAMMDGGPKFEGKIKITARFSPTGAVLPRKGSLEGSTGSKKPVIVGKDKIANVVIDTKL